MEFNVLYAPHVIYLRDKMSIYIHEKEKVIYFLDVTFYKMLICQANVFKLPFKMITQNHADVILLWS